MAMKAATKEATVVKNPKVVCILTKAECMTKRSPTLGRSGVLMRKTA